MGGSDGGDGGGGGRGVLGVNAEYSLQHFIFTKHLCLIGFCEFFKIYRDLDWTVRLDFSNQREITRTEVSVMSERSLLSFAITSRWNTVFTNISLLSIWNFKATVLYLTISETNVVVQRRYFIYIYI